MKKTLLLLLLASPMLLPAQSSVTANAGSASIIPPPTCLACPGGEWATEYNIYAADGNTSDVLVYQNGFCFQSSCYLSRYLEASGFSFNIPLTAVIDSIRLNVLRKASAGNAIYDSIIMLEPDQMTGPVGTDMAQLAQMWPPALAGQVYGNSSDPLWGYAWTPALLNSNSFGALIKVRNVSNMQQTASVDHVAMTIYYSIGTAVYSTTSSAGTMRLTGSATAQPSLELQLSKASQVRIRITDVTGRLVSETTTALLTAGKQQLELPAVTIPAGIYQVTAETDSERMSVNWVKAQ